jgi:hypothetical protein
VLEAIAHGERSDAVVREVSLVQLAGPDVEPPLARPGGRPRRRFDPESRPASFAGSYQQRSCPAPEIAEDTRSGQPFDLGDGSAPGFDLALLLSE